MYWSNVLGFLSPIWKMSTRHCNSHRTNGSGAASEVVQNFFDTRLFNTCHILLDETGTFLACMMELAQGSTPNNHPHSGCQTGDAGEMALYKAGGKTAHMFHQSHDPQLTPSD